MPLLIRYFCMNCAVFFEFINTEIGISLGVGTTPPYLYLEQQVRVQPPRFFHTPGYLYREHFTPAAN
jgi:hypothetical protein